MNFLLKNLELELGEHHLIVGEKLFEQGKVLHLFENERNLWIATVDSMEVEMQVSPSKVRACSCECGRFQEEAMCGHVAAGLLALRRHLSEKEPGKKKPGRRRPVFYQKLTTTSILDNVGPDDLAAFVRHYAKSNRNFALALKTRFASNVPMPDSREKYGQLLDATILAGRNKSDRVSAAGANLLVKTIRELLAQTEDALALEHFGEGWATLAGILEKTAPILRKIDGDAEPLKAAIGDLFEKADQLTRQQIPPALRLEIWDFLLETLPRPAYRLNGLHKPVLDLLLRLGDEEDQNIKLLQAIDREIVKTQNQEHQTHLFLRAKMSLLTRKGMQKHAENFTLQCLASPQAMIQAIDAAQSGGQLGLIRPILEKGLRLVEVEAVREKIEQALLDLAQEQGDWRTATELARGKFLETKNFEYFESCKENFKGDWATFVQNLLSDFIQQPDYQDHIETMATILARENRRAELLALLTEHGSLDLFMQFDHLLVEAFRKDVFEFYERQLKNYLSSHFGPVPSQRVKTVLGHLRSSGADGLAGKLAASLLASFAHRFSLVEELEVF